MTINSTTTKEKNQQIESKLCICMGLQPETANCLLYLPHCPVSSGGPCSNAYETTNQLGDLGSASDWLCLKGHLL